MTEEEKIIETGKSREKYFYIDKEKTYQVLTGIATSFIGAGLALIVFAALHKPPVPPCGMNRPMPCPIRMAEPHRGQPPMMIPPKQDFNGDRESFRFHEPLRGHGDLKGRDLKKGKFTPKKNIPENDTPISNENIPANTPKK